LQELEQASLPIQKSILGLYLGTGRSTLNGPVVGTSNLPTPRMRAPVAIWWTIYRQK